MERKEKVIGDQEDASIPKEEKARQNITICAISKVTDE